MGKEKMMRGPGGTLPATGGGEEGTDEGVMLLWDEQEVTGRGCLAAYE
jgi:hypothetical protein